MWFVRMSLNDMEDNSNSMKVCICLIYVMFLTASSTSSSLESQLNAVHKNGANLRRASGLTKPTNLSSLMRVQSAVERYIEGPGLYAVGKLLEKAFFCRGRWSICSLVLCCISPTTVPQNSLGTARNGSQWHNTL